MYKFDAVSQVILRLIHSADQPLETAEILYLINKEIKVSRRIILARLHALKDADLINGRFMGPGKGVWVWWKKDSFKLPADKIFAKKIDDKLISIINSSNIPLETKEIKDQVPELSHAQVLRLLTTIWGDGVIKGKQVGSGKGVWVWWRLNAFEK